MRILVVPSGFKESLDAEQAAECMKEGILRVLPLSQVQTLPMVDGGEGFTKAIVKISNGSIIDKEVTGPVGEKVPSHFGIFGSKTTGQTAVIEMAAAAGLRLVPRSLRDPRKTTTHGVGELIKAALDMGADRILLGCGDSGTSDGGAGMAQALGAKFLDDSGQEIRIEGGISLAKVTKIDVSGMDKRLKQVQIDVACNWFNKLCGENGVARVFGPQKGATPEQVVELEAALEQFAAIIERDFGIDVRNMPGSGASGGLGAGLHALTGANLYPRYDIIMKYIDLDRMLQETDLVFTAEGSIDFQTPRGKIPVEVAKRAKKHALPVVALVGTVGKGARLNYEYGIDAYTSILPMPSTLEEAFMHAQKWLTDCSESSMRTIMVGLQLANRLMEKEQVS
ncbi:glycerate kinase family protein [Brevibacillus brevis]|uniref:glycerate kinase family protein n=1 Tax=Brevibacillus brevis TaxID=1393 RepID=UPI000D100DAD|nr:glycerate kinase [Brevibacillus brevis]PSJ66041.1 glycerate kinase [Brevibacillus brevis]GEC88754.1 glycerate kinase [Brevibacillus brevis]